MARDVTLLALTPTQQDLFLSVYRETGLMQRAAKAAGTTKSQIEKFVQGKHAEAETFGLNLQDAADTWADTIRTEVTRRAITGIEKGVYHKGVLVDTEMVYSDTLLVKMMEATLPEYKKTPEAPTGGVTIMINTFSDRPAPEVVIDVTPNQSTYISDLE